MPTRTGFRLQPRNVAWMAAHGYLNGLHVYLFGAPRLVLDGRPVVLKAPPRTLPLLVSLLLDAPGGHDPRGRAARRVWPDVEETEARKNLRRHLSYLRKAIERLGLPAPDLGDLRIDTDIVAWTDVRAFETLGAVGESAESAAELYTAPLLSSFDDEEWLVPHRLRYQREYVDLTIRLVDRDWADGRHAQALARAERALEIEPLAEEIVQAALRLSIEVGDRAAGLATYDRFANRLRHELEAEPLKDTRALVDRLKQRATSVALPANADSFFGREREVTALSELLRGRACVALYGPPGIGKSRLAATLAAREAHRFPDGVAWIEIDRIGDGASVEISTLRALGARTESATLPDALAGQSALVVFDACESKAEEIAELVRTSVRRSPGSRFMLTSTRFLHLEAAEWTVEPLRSADAIALFADRASAVTPRNAFGTADRATIAAICAALDGIPLAIELAARRLRSRSLETILNEANTSLDSALANAIARSLMQLPRSTRDVFFQVAAFKGAFRAETAAGVCELSIADATTALERLAAFSLITVVSHEAETRFEMLGTMKSYARDTVEPARFAGALERHAIHFTQRPIERDAVLRGAHAFEAYGEIEGDYAEIAAALDYSIARPEWTERAGRVCLALSRFWYDRAYLADGLRYTDVALTRLETAGNAEALAAELAWVLAWLKRNAGDYRASYVESVAALGRLAVAGAPPARLASAELLAANAARMIGEYSEALRRARAALETLSALDLPYHVGFAHLCCGTICLSADDIPSAREHLVAALGAYEEIGARADAALALLNLVECAHGAGELDLADTLANEAVERCIEAGNVYFLAYANHAVARIAIARRNWSAASRLLMTVSRHAREFGDRELIALCAESVAELAHSSSRFTSAAMLVGASDAERDRAGAPRAKFYQPALERLRAELQAKLGADTERHAELIGGALSSRDLPGRVEAALRDALRVLTRDATDRVP